METESVRAQVQYGDCHGTASADIRDDWRDLDRFAREYGVDVGQYEPIGIELSMGEYHGDHQEPPVSIHILAIDRKDLHGAGYEAIGSYLRSVEKPELVVIEIRAGLNDFLRCFKRLEMKLFVHGGKQVLDWEGVNWNKVVIKERIHLSQ